MLKLFTTLARGAVADVEETVFDANAMRVLNQQLRQAAGALEQSRRDLACAVAYQASEDRAIAVLGERIGALETSCRKAIKGGRNDLAEEVAIEIAALEDERNDRCRAADRGKDEIARLRLLVDEGRKRLLALRRGLELARAQEALNRAGANGRRAVATGRGALREAEATLARILATHAREQDMATALDDMESTATGRDLDMRLDKAGFGSVERVKPADVLKRLQANAAAKSLDAP
jgi:phage shock protein A